MIYLHVDEMGITKIKNKKNEVDKMDPVQFGNNIHSTDAHKNVFRSSSPVVEGTLTDIRPYNDVKELV
ncbi:hypothetical protein NECAME_01862 [Necator americanus]|uniref:Uncharacterized protein n=1 Tax=Necator americanus TaxID=51031 RepID=W2TMR2_NECAM|nr:hypothetical protein NECAME_01862 [Necator americanus]ETN83063.1 hypothetical protein NECAME_01862 [Necator americanus]